MSNEDLEGIEPKIIIEEHRKKLVENNINGSVEKSKLGEMEEPSAPVEKDSPVDPDLKVLQKRASQT